MQYKTSTIKKLNKVENSTSHPLLIKSFFIFSIFCFIALASKMSSAILPNLQPSPTVTSGGGNVTSVSSGDGCIFVSPTTGDVVITFNTSCGTGSSAVTSVVAGSNFLIIDPTTGDVIVNINSTTLNNTIANYGVAVGFNSTFNSTYAQFAYNQTTAVFTMTLLNDTIAQYGVAVGFNSTFNQTYNNLLGQNCPVGLVVNGTLINGTLICTTVNALANFTNVAYLNNTQTFTVNQTINANLTVSQTVFANLFVGSLNWTNLIGIPNIIYGLWTTQNANNLLISNGTAIGYNQTIFNNSVAAYGVAVGFNSTFNETYKNLLGQQCPAGEYQVNGTLANGTFTCSNLTQTVRRVDGQAPYIFTNPATGNVVVIFNETKANQTINNLIGVGNKTTVHCSNVTGNTLCTTGTPTFANITTTDRFLSTLAGVSGVWHQYFVLGTAVEVGRVTSELGVFQIRSASNLDIYFSNDDTTGFFSVNDAGETFARTSKTFFVDNGASTTRSFETNMSGGTTLYSNVSIKGTRLTAPCPLGIEGCIANFTGWNITSNHQSYNMTNLINLDTTYRNNNTNGRPIRVSMNFDSQIIADISGAIAYVTLYVNGTEVDSEGMVLVDLGASTGTWRFSVEGDVQPNLPYSFNTSVSGGGQASVTKRAVWIYVD